MKITTNAIVDEQRSLFNGEEIIILATGFDFSNENNKIGKSVLQLWVFPKNTAPHIAVKDGSDVSVCGNCPLRPSKGNICYVITGFAPKGMYESFERGGYSVLTQDQIKWVRDRQMILRLTAYGDIAAIDINSPNIKALRDAAKETLAYTHSWNVRPELKGTAMASVETVAGALKAQAKGWKTFRVKAKDEPLLSNEVLCPYEVNPLVQCEDCCLCTGNKCNVAVSAHGSSGKAKRHQELFQAG